MASLKEKVGYGLGDMASSTYWKIFSAYLPFFYASVCHLPLEAAAMLMFVARMWDAVSDPMMGIIADRTDSRWGRYRPYLLWMAIPFALAGVLLLSVPFDDETRKVAWAYFSYLLMMTVYTAINVPYGSMLTVMTEDSDEKTVFSSFRMFFAYGGSFIILFAWEPLCRWVASLTGAAYTTPMTWTYAMTIVGLYCAVLFYFTFRMTREHVQTSVSANSVGSDLMTLLRNAPWWILLGGVLFFNFFGAVRYSVIPFYFTTFIPADSHLGLFGLDLLFYAGLFFGVGEVANMLGVATTPFFTRRVGKKLTFLICLLLLIALCIAFYYVPTQGVAALWTLLALQVAVSILTGIVSPLVWSMYADVADFAELKFRTASTGLIFSSSSMAQKFGGAIGGAAVLSLLSLFHFDTAEGAVQTAEATEGLRLLMSYIPAVIAAIAALFIALYPLGEKRIKAIGEQLQIIRNQNTN